MKKVILGILSGCIFSWGVHAQDSNEASTLIGSGSSIKKEDLGFFVSPLFGLSEMDGSSAALLNLRAGLNWKDKVSLGAYYTTALNELYPQSETLLNVYMDYWSAGAFASYSVWSKKLVHLSFPLFIGFGEVQMDNEAGDPGLGESNFLQAEPSALLEVNIHKYLRFNIGAGYRMLGNMRYRNMNQQDIAGPTAYAGLKFGIFK